MAMNKFRGRVARAAISATLAGAMSLGGLIAPVGMAFASEGDGDGGATTSTVTRLAYEEHNKVTFKKFQKGTEGAADSFVPAYVFGWQVFKADVSAETEEVPGVAGAAATTTKTGNSVAKNVEWASPAMQTAVMNYINGDGNYTGWLSANSLQDSTVNALRYITEKIDEDRANGFAYDQDENDSDDYRVEATGSFAQGLGNAIMNTEGLTRIGPVTEIDATTTSTEMNEGYWLVMKSNDANNDGAAPTGPAMWIPVGGTVGQITLKTTYGTIAKYVTDDESVAGTEEKVADVAFGQDLTFKLAVTMPETGPSTEFVITDTLPKGMELTGIVFSKEPGHESEVTSGIDITTSKDTPAVIGTGTAESPQTSAVPALTTNPFTITVTEKTDGEYVLTLTAAGDGLTALGELNAKGDGSPATVYVSYKATLNANATKGLKTPNENKATVKIDGEETEESIAKVYTYQLRIDKVDGEGNPLKDASFTIQDLNTGEYVAGAGTLVSKPDGASDDWQPPIIAMNEFSTLTIPYMDQGTYKVMEVKSPDDYADPTADDFFTLTIEAKRDNDVISDLTASAEANADSKLLSAVINADETNADTGLIVVTVTNGDSQIVLPVTGMTPNQLGTLIGALLVATGAVVIVVRRRQAENA